MREFLRGLELDEETIDTIMAEHGKLVTKLKEENSNLKDKMKEHEVKIKELEELSSDSQKIQEELEKYRTEEKERKLMSEFEEAFKGKQFVNDFTKKAIFDEVKKQLENEENKDKTIKDLTELVVKDKEGLFIEDKQEKQPFSSNGVPIQKIATNKEDGVMAILKSKHPNLYE